MKLKLSFLVASLCLLFACTNQVEKDLHTNITNSNILVSHINNIKDTFAQFLDDKAKITDIENQIQKYEDTYQKVLNPYLNSKTSNEIQPLQGYLKDSTEKAQDLVNAIKSLIRSNNSEENSSELEPQSAKVEQCLKDFTNSFEELTVQQMQFAEKNEITSVEF